MGDLANPLTLAPPCIINTAAGWLTPGDGLGTYVTKGAAALSMLVENNSGVGNGYIDLAGTISGATIQQGDLYINQKCANNTRINLGGGTVFMGDQVRMNKHVEIGTASAVNDPANTSLDIFTNDGKGLKFNTYNNGMPLISIANTNFAYSPFTVLGAGQTGINNGNPYKQLTVNGDVSFANYAPVTGNPTDGFNGLEILGNNQIPTRRGITTDADPNGNLNFYIHSFQTAAAFNFKDGNGNKDLVKIYTDGKTEINVSNSASKMFVVKDPSLATNVQEKFVVNGDGKTFIGGVFATTTPYMLTVNGRIGAREIKVSLQNPWPDYVFAKEYKLTSLENTEIYLKENKHLPNIPSADELKKDELGLDLAQMQGLQMEKIEEIYLHLIELNKQVKELKKENHELKAKLKNK